VDNAVKSVAPAKRPKKAGSLAEASQAARAQKAKQRRYTRFGDHHASDPCQGGSARSPR
jgi:hypothetical protein